MSIFTSFKKDPVECLGKLEQTVSKLEQIVTKAEEPLYFTEGGMFERIARLDGKYEVYDANYKKNTTVDLHNHPEIEVFIVVSGSLILNMHGAKRMMGRGDVAMVGPLVPHGFEFPLDTNFVTIAIPPLGDLNAK